MYSGANYVLDGDIIYVGLIKMTITDSAKTSPSYLSIRYIYSNEKKCGEELTNLTKKF